MELLGDTLSSLAGLVAGIRLGLVTGRDKQGFNFTNVCEVPNSTACCLTELFFTRLKMPSVYNCVISNKCAEFEATARKKTCQVRGLSFGGLFAFSAK